MDEKVKCVNIKDKEACGNLDHDDIFSRRLIGKPIMKKDERNLYIDKQCKLGGGECVTRNLFTGVVFFSIFVGVGIAWVFMHEMFHVITFMALGVPIGSFSFGTMSGGLNATIPEGAPSIWYFFAIGCPLLFVNALTVFLTMLAIPLIDRRSAFYERTVVENPIALGTLGIKALGTFSAFILLGNTILLPFTSIIMKSIATFTGDPISYSDMEIWWNAILTIANDGERLLSQLVYIGVFAMEASLGIAFFMTVRKGGSRYSF